MIVEIEIIIRNNPDKELVFFLDLENRRCFINNQEKQITESDIKRIKEVLVFFENDEITHTFDDEEFIIRINTRDSVEEIKGKGTYHKYYQLLKEIIGEIDGR